MILPVTQTGKLRNMTSVYLLREDKILLLYRLGNSIVHDLWIASAGGHFEQEELNDPRTCVLRELREELNLGLEDIEDLRLRYVTLRKADSEIRQNYYFFANLKPDITPDLESTEGIAKWFSLEQTASLPMPIAARHVVDHYIRTGRLTEHLYGAIVSDKETAFIEL